uniref:Coiled-coil domain-containing protein 132 n=1 Tax=Lygus hesperus TaxID=30085 RepID=A0A0A9XFR7_LYGHE
MEKVDELKSKFLDLIQGNAKIPVVGNLPDYELLHQEKATEVSTSNSQPPERPSDQEILESIDEKYFTIDKDFDAGRYELGKIENMSNTDKIEEYLQQLRQQQLVVSNNVLQMILEKQSACQDEFNNVVDVEKCVEDALHSVKESRSKLETATRHFTTASLGILANYRKRTLVQQLLRYLKTIKTMHETESRMPDLFKNGDYSGAIDLLLECQRVAARYRHFTCIDALSSKLQDTLVMAEEHLDGALSTMCQGFDEFVYRELQSAYALLGKTEVAIDQLHMHFISAVQKKSCFVVQSYSVIEASSSEDKKLYPQLCKDIPEEHFIPCLLTLCRALWQIILSYHKVVTWHLKNPRENKGDAGFEANYNEQYVKNKLNSGLAKLWQDVQTKVSSLVLAANLSNYKIDDFLEVLSILHRFSQIGEELCDSESKEVADSVRTQSICYFNKFHADKLDDLKVFLENEAWTPCPVREDFTCLHLQEFRGLRSCVEQCAGISGRHNDSSVDGSSTGANFFNRFPDPKGPTPFDMSFHPDSRDEHIMSSVNEDMSGYYSEESEEDVAISPDGVHTGKHSKFGTSATNRCRLLTNTTLSVLRLCGKYLQMSRLLRSISVEVVTALTQLFEYYLYTIHTFFASDTPNCLCPSVSSLKLVSVIKRIKESLLQNESQDLDVTVDEALVSPMVDLQTSETLYGLRERVVAVESLIFLAQEFEFLKKYLEQLLESQGSSIHYLQQFYSQTVSVAHEMRKPVYACVAWRSVDSRQVLAMMSKVDWEVKEIMSEHSKYVDFIFQELHNFKKGLTEVDSTIQIPEPSVHAIWECLVMLIAHLFVEGFASSKKCSSAGRALMQLDFAQYMSKLEKLCPLRPVPYYEFVEVYAKAYYQIEEDLENWIKEHSEYSSKQLLALVSCTCQSKKNRQRLTAFIEEMEKKDIR